MSHRLGRAVPSVELMEVYFLPLLLGSTVGGEKETFSYSLKLSCESQGWASELFLLCKSFDNLHRSQRPVQDQSEITGA